MKLIQLCKFAIAFFCVQHPIQNGYSSSLVDRFGNVIFFLMCLIMAQIPVKNAGILMLVCEHTGCFQVSMVLVFMNFRLIVSENVSSRRQIVTAAALVVPTKARKTVSIRSVPDARGQRIVWTLLSLLHPSVFPVTCRQVIERICLVT